DSSKLNDAIAAAGVNLQQEEDLMAQQQLNRRSELSGDLKSMLRGAKPPAFLNAFHVASFMNKVAKENGVQQNFLQDGELLELVSSACEYWMSNILTKTIILSRHRRRGIPALNPSNTNTNNKSKKATSSNSASRSELSKGLRDLATKQKELEEKRVAKRVLLGLEKNALDAAEAALENSKAGAEETLHRAANATAAMMTMNPGRKKYSWMTSNAGNNDQNKGAADKDGKNKQSSIISVRGDNGLRFREIRSGNSVTMKDLLGAIEDERMGTEKAIIKGFAKLKD
ncbi:transcription factor TFIID subunit, partial [Suhomyces tanzawaensis NRRL Y-17324]